MNCPLELKNAEVLCLRPSDLIKTLTWFLWTTFGLNFGVFWIKTKKFVQF